MKQFFTTLFLLGTTILSAQTIADFENFNLADDSHLNGSDGSEEFESGNVILPVDYISGTGWEAWSGFSISNKKDTGTPGPDNQYSAITGKGVQNSPTYAVSYAFDPVVLKLNDNAIGQPIEGLYITNSTWAYWSMKDGDNVAKKFGGITGSDPDWFKVTFKAYRSGFLLNNGVDFYLADYQSDDDADDYIHFTWEWVDLTSLGNVDSLQISLSSSDVGGFGMNTPAYFCIDNVTTASEPLSNKNLNSEIDFSIYPNPASEYLIFEWNEQNGLAQVIDFQGKTWSNQLIQKGQNRIDLNALPRGFYSIQIQTENGFLSEKFVKE